MVYWYLNLNNAENRFHAGNRDTYTVLFAKEKYINKKEEIKIKIF